MTTSGQSFPQYTDPFVDQSGRITRSWRYLLQALWNRTGQQAGVISVPVPANEIIVGSASGVGSAVPMSGDATIVASGAVTVSGINGKAISVYSPPGAIIDFGGASAPTGWLLCDGSAVSRTTYSALFAAIGTKWGVGDGSTTFNLPYLIKSGSVGVSLVGPAYTATIKIIKT